MPKITLNEYEKAVYKRLLDVKKIVHKQIESVRHLHYTDGEKEELKDKSYLYGLRKALIKKKIATNKFDPLEREELGHRLLQKLEQEEREVLEMLQKFNLINI